MKAKGSLNSRDIEEIIYLIQDRVTELQRRVRAGQHDLEMAEKFDFTDKKLHEDWLIRDKKKLVRTKILLKKATILLAQIQLQEYEQEKAMEVREQ